MVKKQSKFSSKKSSKSQKKIFTAPEYVEIKKALMRLRKIFL